jgi:chemotaxis signal transduction protein
MDFISFKAHRQLYAVRIDEAVATMLKPPITAVPGTIPAVCGMFSYLGELIPVVDISMLYFGEEDVTATHVIIVVGDHKYAILVESIHDIIRQDVPSDVMYLSIHDIENAVMNRTEVVSESERIELF